MYSQGEEEGGSSTTQESLCYSKANSSFPNRHLPAES